MTSLGTRGEMIADRAHLVAAAQPGQIKVHADDPHDLPADAQACTHRPARLDDLLLVTTRLQELGRASMTLEQVAWLGADANAQRLCEGQIRIGWVDASAMKPMRIPATLIDKLHNA